MEINIPLLLQYIKKNKFSSTVNVSIDTPEPYLILIAGDNHEGSRREYLDFTDLNEILIINNIIGKSNTDSSLVKEQLELLKTDSRDRYKRPENIERLIYDTLAKYIIQILLAATGDVYYPEVKPLDKHKTHFTKR